MYRDVKFSNLFCQLYNLDYSVNSIAVILYRGTTIIFSHLSKIHQLLFALQLVHDSCGGYWCICRILVVCDDNPLVSPLRTNGVFILLLF